MFCTILLVIPRTIHCTNFNSKICYIGYNSVHDRLSYYFTFRILCGRQSRKTRKHALCWSEDMASIAGAKRGNKRKLCESSLAFPDTLCFKRDVCFVLGVSATIICSQSEWKWRDLVWIPLNCLLNPSNLLPRLFDLPTFCFLFSVGGRTWRNVVLSWFQGQSHYFVNEIIIAKNSRSCVIRQRPACRPLRFCELFSASFARAFSDRNNKMCSFEIRVNVRNFLRTSWYYLSLLVVRVCTFCIRYEQTFWKAVGKRNCPSVFMKTQPKQQSTSSIEGSSGLISRNSFRVIDRSTDKRFLPSWPLSS